MISLGETKWGIFGNYLYYLCNFSVNLELLQCKKFTVKKDLVHTSLILVGHQGWDWGSLRQKATLDPAAAVRPATHRSTSWVLAGCCAWPSRRCPEPNEVNVRHFHGKCQKHFGLRTWHFEEIGSEVWPFGRWLEVAPAVFSCGRHPSSARPAEPGPWLRPSVLTSRPHRELEGGRGRLGRVLLRAGLGLSQKERACGPRVHMHAKQLSHPCSTSRGCLACGRWRAAKPAACGAIALSSQRPGSPTLRPPFYGWGSQGWEGKEQLVHSQRSSRVWNFLSR